MVRLLLYISHECLKSEKPRNEEESKSRRGTEKTSKIDEQKKLIAESHWREIIEKISFSYREQ